MQWSTKEPEAPERPTGLARLAIEPPAAGDALRVADAAAGLLMEAARSTNPLIRANAIEALLPARDAAAPMALRALDDPNRGVRFVAAMTVGELRTFEAEPRLRRMLRDESDSVRAAAIYALTRIGAPVDPSPLGSMIVSSDSEVKGNAAIVLGLLGDPAALPLLRDAVQRASILASTADTRRVDMQIAEAMVRLGEEREIEVIRAALFAPDDQAEFTVLACQMLGQLGDRAYLGALQDKATRRGAQQEPIEVRLAAAAAAARLDPLRAPIEAVLEQVGNESFVVRAQAAHGLGWFRDARVPPVVTTMLSDPNALVQVAAAGSALRLLERERLAGAVP